MDPMLDPSFHMLRGSSDEDEVAHEDKEFKSKSDKKSRNSKRKKKSSKRHHHKSVKDKKKHKKHHKKYSSSDSGSSSSEESDEWVEKDISTPSTSLANTSKANHESKNVKESESKDMELLFNVVRTYSNDSRKQKRKNEKQAERELSSIDQVGLHERELNPYWKNGGTGLPESSPSKANSSSTVGDGGLSWLKKSYQRAKEQAQEEGKDLEEIAAERWGSLNNFYAMLEEAESKASAQRSGSEREMRRDRNFHGERSKPSFKRPARDSDEDDGRGYDEPKSSRNYKSFSSQAQTRPKPGWLKRTNEPLHSETQHDDKRRKDASETMIERLSERSATPLASSPSSNDEKEVETPETEVQVLTDKEMNELNAKIIKAELLSNNALVEELKKKLSEAQQARDEFIKNGPASAKQSDSKRVVTKLVLNSQSGKRLKNKPTETHKDGKRVRYFPDDDKQSLANMFQKERMNTVEDENALFARLAGSSKAMKATDEYDLDDIFEDKASSSKSVHKEQEREVRKVLDAEKLYKRTIEDCNWCFDGKVQKNIVIAIGEKSFLCVPPFQSLTEGHCIIVPMSHSPCTTEIDEDVWAEIQKFRQAVVRMYSDMDQDVVLFESALFLKSHPHMYIECVPMPKETGELAPIYFKKAIQECETEWAQNKKVVDLRGKDIRRGIPKGLPYFWVDFGLDSGFAHAIEDEQNFPRNFAQEIIGGMMELDHHLWRKQKRDDFKAQQSKVMKFLTNWGPYDWTRETS